MDLADAAGLSIVHINRTFQELRRLNILSEGRTITVSDRERLVRLAGFDGKYLNMPQLLSHWRVEIGGKTVCPLSRGGSPYTALSRVTRSGRANPHGRRTSRGAL